jgi:hypothetical protein
MDTEKNIEYHTVVVWDTAGTFISRFEDPVNSKIKEMSQSGWILDSNELVRSGNIFSSSKRRLIFHKGSIPVSTVNNSIGDELTKMSILLNEGRITPDEFNTFKAKLLSK